MANNNLTEQEIQRQAELFHLQQQDKLNEVQQDLDSQSQNFFDQQTINEADQESVGQQLNREKRFDLKRKIERLKRAKEGIDKVKAAQEKIKKLKRIYQIINGTSAITFWGIILTWLIMNAQFWLGNVLGKQFIPKLDWWEIGIVLLLDLVVVVAIFILFFILYMYTHPCEALEFVDLGFLKELCGVVSRLAQ